jgi:hypothetical protein
MSGRDNLHPARDSRAGCRNMRRLRSRHERNATEPFLAVACQAAGGCRPSEPLRPESPQFLIGSFRYVFTFSGMLDCEEITSPTRGAGGSQWRDQQDRWDSILAPDLRTLAVRDTNRIVPSSCKAAGTYPCGIAGARSCPRDKRLDRCEQTSPNLEMPGLTGLGPALVMTCGLWYSMIEQL